MSSIRFQTSCLIITSNVHQSITAWLLSILSLRFLDISQPEITPTCETVVDPTVCSQQPFSFYEYDFSRAATISQLIHRK